MSFASEAPAARHIPVLLQPVIDALMPEGRGLERLIDGTVGGGGHTEALLAAGVEEALALDRDATAIEWARRRLARYGERARFYHGSYTEMRLATAELGWRAVDAILLDLGLSSMQMNDERRGFSFRFDAPLDMRYDRGSAVKASDLVNGLPETELARIFFQYGEERHARRVASAIAAARPVQSTRELADLVASALPRASRRASKIHPATRVFQALRIAVNGELESLERALPMAADLLKPGGRLAVISFHSLEDRIVKRQFREWSTTITAPPGMASIKEKRAVVKLVNRKPIAPSRAEASANPRSRSAKLRVVEKLE